MDHVRVNVPQIPAVVEKHLDAVEYLEDGKLVLTSSNLTGRYWDGSFFCFSSEDHAPDIEKCITGRSVDSGISDMRCLTQNRLVIGMDCGTVELFQLEGEPPMFVSLGSSCEHDNVVSSLSVNCDESLIISSGYDKCIKVWDLESFSSISTYRPVHAGAVWQVACSPVDSQVLLSCGQDAAIHMLDIRLPKPVSEITLNVLKSDPSAIAWKPVNGFHFVVGDDTGCISIIDIRNLKLVTQYDSHKRRIHRLVFSKSNPSWLASCADETSVVVRDIGGSWNDFHDDTHTDFVRGLAWSPQNAVISCGWDKQVLKHNLHIAEMDVASPPCPK